MLVHHEVGPLTIRNLWAVEAARLAGEQIEKAVNSVSLPATQQKGPADQNQQALVEV
jgi:hypothetical protein